MEEQNPRVDSKNYLPAVFGLLFLLIAGGLWVTYQKSLNPDVIQSQAALAEKNALVWQAREPFYEQLPSILVSGAYFVLAILLGIGVASMLLSLATMIIGSVASRMVENGVGYYKSTPEGETKVYIAPPNTVVAAHLDRLADRSGSSVIIDGRESALPAGRTSLLTGPADQEAGPKLAVVKSAGTARHRTGTAADSKCSRSSRSTRDSHHNGDNKSTGSHVRAVADAIKRGTVSDAGSEGDAFF